jgi:glutamyl-tRNA synthetase
VPTGRFAPSPTGPLHVGNLRTAVIAWLVARSAGSRFLVRIDDLDRVASREEHVRSHLADLAALGVVGDGEVVRQSGRFDRYEAAIGRLDAAGLVYPCYCSRREVREAVAAPHGPLPEGAYPGTCRDLGLADRAAREAEGRRPAWRVRAGAARVRVEDRRHGTIEGIVDDFVVRRADGAPAYQVAVVVDDHDQGVEEVVRGDDLLDTTPRQVWLAGVLGLRVPAYAHVPLVLGPDGERLAKRHGAVTLADLAARGVDAPHVLGMMAVSLGLRPPAVAGGRVAAVGSVADLLDGFSLDLLPADPWVFSIDH